MGLRREPALDASHAWPLGTGIAADDVEAAAEVVAVGGDQDSSHALVAVGCIERVDQAGDHHVVERVALRRSVEAGPQKRSIQFDDEPVDGCVTVLTHRFSSAQILTSLD